MLWWTLRGERDVAAVNPGTGTGLLQSIECLFFGVLICILLPLAARAHDLIQPDWRGQKETTFQQWTFDNNDNPAAPEVVNNDYGTPTAVITIGAYGIGWLDYFPQIGTQQGYWDLGGAGGRIVVDVENRPGGSVFKEIWVQVTYWEDISQAPTVSVSGATYVDGQTLLVEHVSTGGNWLLQQSIWRIDPGPDHEQIVVTSDPSGGSLIDQIVVDTLSPTGCLVAFDDLYNFASQWLLDGPGLDADLDGDNDVDLRDFAILARFWLVPCPNDWPWP